MKIFKKLISLVVLSTISTTLAFNTLPEQSFQAYENQQTLEINNIAVPTLVEFNYEIQKYPILIIDEQNTSYGYQSTTIYESDKFQVTSPQKISNLKNIKDGKFQTSTQLKLVEESNTTTLNFKTQEAYQYDSLTIDYKQNSQKTDYITIEAKTNGNYETLFAKSKTSASQINFPKTKTQEFKITLEHSQPLVINEIQFRRNQDRQAIYNQYKFLAIPDQTYTIYTDADRNPNYQLPETGRFKKQQTTINGKLINQAANPKYQAADTDKDTILDKQDNCPQIANSDQADLNKNSIGDACEDFDGDRVLNANDNCPNQANYNQKDQDNDKIGDACDNQENRITEKLPWLQWLALGITAAIIIYLTVKQSD